MCFDMIRVKMPFVVAEKPNGVIFDVKTRHHEIMWRSEEADFVLVKIVEVLSSMNEIRVSFKDDNNSTTRYQKFNRGDNGSSLFSERKNFLMEILPIIHIGMATGIKEHLGWKVNRAWSIPFRTFY